MPPAFTSFAPDKDEERPDSTRPPVLAGYTYDPREAYGARDAARLLAIRLETNRSCNLRCRYCYAESESKLDHATPVDELERVVRQAQDLGALSVVVIGGGEPTIHPRFRDLISLIHSLGMVPVVFTNTMTMTADLASFLLATNASVMGKLDSLRPEIQDFLSGQNGVLARIRQGLGRLIDAGFTRVEEPGRFRLGLSVVTNRLNQNEIEEIWRFCRDRSIFPNLEVLTPTGRAATELPGLGLTREEVQAYKLRLLEIDRTDYGFDWLPHTPLPASGCLQHLYSLYITIEGNVRPCAPTKFDENPALRVNGVYPHNVRTRSLREIYNDQLFDYVRHIDRHLEGKCRECEHLCECIGCRGYSYSVGTNEGKDPYTALRGECLQCLK
ncbi:MAG: radical SAM protein [Dehalococcoidia bacterium]|nr:radical SAM protein [Dehalococcoidia bacterium]